MTAAELMEYQEWAREEASHVEILTEAWQRNVGKYTAAAQRRFRAYVTAAYRAEKQLEYWREQIAEACAPWFDTEEAPR